MVRPESIYHRNSQVGLDGCWWKAVSVAEFVAPCAVSGGETLSWLPSDGALLDEGRHLFLMNALLVRVVDFQW